MNPATDLPKPASTVVLVRDAPGGAGNLEVLMVRRSAGMASLIQGNSGAL